MNRDLRPLFSVPVDMPKRGGVRPRCVKPNEDARVWCASGRWGPRRVRVTQCLAVLRAEDLYTDVLRRDPAHLIPGDGGSLTWTLDWGVFAIEWGLRPNAVWRFGRLFLTCPNCLKLATRIYVPTTKAPPACRQCWGLTYASRKYNGARSGADRVRAASVRALGVTLARLHRRQASVERWAERRVLLQELEVHPRRNGR